MRNSEAVGAGFIAVLCLAVGIASPAAAQESFWIPADPPEAHYAVEARLNAEELSISGAATVSFENTTSEPMSYLCFWFFTTEGSVMRVRLADRELEKAWQNGPLRYFRLPEPLVPGRGVELIVEFELCGMFHSEDQYIRTSIWFPMLHWGDLGVVHSSTAIRLDVPPGWEYVLSGRLNSGRYEAEGVRISGIFLGKGMKKASRQSEGVLITTIYSADMEEGALLNLETAADAVAFYKSWLGFYPYDFLNIVPGGPGVWGGWPLATGVVGLHGQAKFDTVELLHWQHIVAHEIGHQYWGEWVLDADDPGWLWIGLGIYADREYVMARSLAMDEHEGFFNRYLSGVREHKDTTIDTTPERADKVDFSFNNVVIHGKGFAVISALESVLGREKFQQIYSKCLELYGGRRLGYRQLWRLCEAETGRSLGWFFEQWARSNAYLFYQVAEKTCEPVNGRFRSRVTIRQRGTMAMPIPVRAVFEDGGSQTQKIDRLRRLNTLEFVSDTPLAEVVLDPLNQFAMVDEPLPLTPEFLRDTISRLPYDGRDYDGAWEDGLEAFENAGQIELDHARSWFRLAVMLFGGRHYEQCLFAWRRYAELDTDEDAQFVSKSWQGIIYDVLGDREEALRLYNEALTHPVNGATYTYSQYDLTINEEWVRERLQMPYSMDY